MTIAEQLERALDAVTPGGERSSLSELPTPSITPDPLPEPADSVQPDSVGRGPADSVQKGPGAPHAAPTPRGVPPSVGRRPGPLPYHTIQDVNELLREVREGRMDTRDFTPGQRRAVLAAVADGKRTRKELAALLHVSTGRIDRDLIAIRSRVGKRIQSMDVESAIGFLTEAMEQSSILALERKDGAGNWAIKRDYLRSLKELGLFAQAGDRETTKLTIAVLGERYASATEKLALAMSNQAACGEDPRNERLKTIDAAAARVLVGPEELPPLPTPATTEAEGDELEDDGE